MKRFYFFLEPFLFVCFMKRNFYEYFYLIDEGDDGVIWFGGFFFYMAFGKIGEYFYEFSSCFDRFFLIFCDDNSFDLFFWVEFLVASDFSDSGDYLLDRVENFFGFCVLKINFWVRSIHEAFGVSTKLFINRFGYEWTKGVY